VLLIGAVGAHEATNNPTAERSDPSAFLVTVSEIDGVFLYTSASSDSCPSCGRLRLLSSSIYKAPIYRDPTDSEIPVLEKVLSNTVPPVMAWMTAQCDEDKLVPISCHRFTCLPNCTRRYGK